MQQFKKEIRLFDAVMMVAGTMIGSAIFIVSADMVRQVGSSGWLLFAWALTALLTLLCAISYGELCALFPNAGGQYVYLREAFGKLRAGYTVGACLVHCLAERTGSSGDDHHFVIQTHSPCTFCNP